MYLAAMLSPLKYEVSRSIPSIEGGDFIQGETLLWGENFDYKRFPELGERVEVKYFLSVNQGHGAVVYSNMVQTVVKKDRQRPTDAEFTEILMEVMTLLRNDTVDYLKKRNIAFNFPELKQEVVLQQGLALRITDVITS